MTVRPTHETLESLRVTLQKLEQTTDLASDGQDVTELKQILLNRIGELEALQVLQPPEAAQPSSPSDLPPLAVSTLDETTSDTSAPQILDKLD
jgi:hypothetical protein